MMWPASMSVPLARNRASTLQASFGLEEPVAANDRVGALAGEEGRDRSGSVPPGGLWEIVTSLPGRARASSQPRSRTSSHREAPALKTSLPPEAHAEMMGVENPDDVPETVLRHRDFCPRRTHKLEDANENNSAVYESYYDVLKRANKWLGDHPDIILVTMETITWCMSHVATGKTAGSGRRTRTPTASDVFNLNLNPLAKVKDDSEVLLEGEEDGDGTATNILSTQQREHLFTDGSVTQRSKSSEENNRFYRGIRLWYFSHGEKFWKTWASERKLHFRDYFPSRNGSVASILRNINEDLTTNSINGHVLRLDTIDVPLDKGSTTCVWSENPSEERRYYSVFRLVYVEFDGADEFKAEIAFRDFCPASDGRSPSTMGYEKFEDMFARAARWLFQQKNAHIINLQTIQVKSKSSSKKDGLEDINLWESANHTEHGQKHTDYLLILRVAYWRVAEGGAARALPPRLSYRTATPAFQGKPTNNHQDRLFHADEFEEASSIIDKISTWLHRSQGRLLSIETLPIRCQSLCQDVHGPEATLLRNQTEDKSQPETIVYCLRIYLDGDFMNIPLDRKWRPVSDMVGGSSRLE